MSGPGTFDSNVTTTPAVQAAGTNGAQGVNASSDSGVGLYVQSGQGIGLHAVGGNAHLLPIKEAIAPSTIPAILAEGGVGGDGLHATSDYNTGVFGTSNSGSGVVGQSTSNSGVSGTSQTGDGVTGTSNSGHGVYGISDTQVGVYGQSTSNWGVLGRSGPQVGVMGQSTSNWGVGGISQTQEGVHGESTSSVGMYGISHSAGNAGVLGINDNTQSGSTGPGVWGESHVSDGVHAVSHSAKSAGIAAWNTAGGNAGLFEGKVQINGTVTIASGSDLIFSDFSEEFDITITAEAEPGTVMVLNQQGALEPSRQAYDKKVAGVISGAGNFRPGLTLDRRESSEGRMPVALVGKVYCRVDAQYAPIEMGDLLTTSPTPGHAMKANDPLKAFGAVIGKALRPLEVGQGLIPILVALQ